MTIHDHLWRMDNNGNLACDECGFTADPDALLAIVRAVTEYEGVQDRDYLFWACGFCIGASDNDAPDGKGIAHTPECPVTQARALLAGEQSDGA